MGFGLLFIGYFIAFLMSFHRYGFLCRIIGYYLIFSSAQKLSEYKRGIAQTVIPLLVMTLCGIYDAGALVSESFFSTPFPQALTYSVDLIELALGFLFHVYLLKGIIGLGEDTELPKVSSFARWNLVSVTSHLILNVILTVSQLCISLFPAFGGETLQALTSTLVRVTLLVGILYPILMLVLIHSCYAQICAPEDLEMKPKPSRFSFINKSREMSAKKDEEMEKWLAERQAKSNKKK